MRILIIEDEQPAAERLRKAVLAYDQDFRIVDTLTGVRQSIHWLKNNPHPDLILLDIELSDGSSLEIFKKVNITCPVIFTTAYDQHLMDAFEHNAIDYILKPLKKEKLEKAFDRYFKLKQHFVADYSALGDPALSTRKSYKKRLLIRMGNEHQSIAVEEIAYAFVDHKAVFLVTHNGKKLLVDKTIADLEAELDPAEFFRLNRQVVAGVRAIRKFRTLEKSKVEVELAPSSKTPVVVSQERAAVFKEWMER